MTLIYSATAMEEIPAYMPVTYKGDNVVGRALAGDVVAGITGPHGAKKDGEVDFTILGKCDVIFAGAVAVNDRLAVTANGVEKAAPASNQQIETFARAIESGEAGSKGAIILEKIVITGA